MTGAVRALSRLFRGLILLETELDCALGRFEIRSIELLFGKYRRAACGDERRVPPTQGNQELGDEVQQHVAAGDRAAGFDEAQMALRDLGVRSEAELAQPPPLTPSAQQAADGVLIGNGSRHDHAPNVAEAASRTIYLRRNRQRLEFSRSSTS